MASLQGNPRKKFNRWVWLIVLAGIFLFLALIFGYMRMERSATYVYLADKYHSFQASALRTRYIFDSYNFGTGKPEIVTDSQVSEIDGMTLIYIPAGEFLMGTPKLEWATAMHSVYLDAYWIDQTEVTNKMYLMCVEAGVCWQPITSDGVNPYYKNPRYDDYPMIYVSWEHAVRYCAWADRRLPTEAEWEKAARGTDGRNYPWGDEKPNSKLANYQDNIGTPLPVDRYPLGASPYGVLNMAGNVREWLADWYDRDTYQENHSINPLGPQTGFERSMRGGHFSDSWQQITTYNRFKHEPESAGLGRGFRCAADAEE